MSPVSFLYIICIAPYTTWSMLLNFKGFPRLTVPTVSIGGNDGAVVGALSQKPPGCGIESNSYPCLWDMFPWPVAPWLYDPGMINAETNSANSDISLPWVGLDKKFWFLKMRTTYWSTHLNDNVNS